jgi:hypothetical protein
MASHHTLYSSFLPSASYISALIIIPPSCVFHYGHLFLWQAHALLRVTLLRFSALKMTLAHCLSLSVLCQASPVLFLRPPTSPSWRQRTRPLPKSRETSQKARPLSTATRPLQLQLSSQTTSSRVFTHRASSPRFLRLRKPCSTIRTLPHDSRSPTSPAVPTTDSSRTERMCASCQESRPSQPLSKLSVYSIYTSIPWRTNTITRTSSWAQASQSTRSMK